MPFGSGLTLTTALLTEARPYDCLIVPELALSITDRPTMSFERLMLDFDKTVNIVRHIIEQGMSEYIDLLINLLKEEE